MNRYAVWALAWVACCYVTSCSLLHSITGRKTTAGNDTTGTVNVDTGHISLPIATVPDSTVKTVAPTDSSKMFAEMLKPFFERRITFSTFSGKAKMRYEGPDQKQEFTAHIRMKKDSAIWINITALGGVVQAARIFITPDSFFMVNYQDKEATKIALNDAAKILPTRLDFSDLQNFIMGDVLRHGQIESVANDAAAWTLTARDTAYIQQYTYDKKDTLLQASSLNINRPNSPRSSIQYSSYMSIDNRKVSSLRVVNIQKGVDTNYMLDMNFTKIDLDQPIDMHFNIPQNFTIK